MKRFNYLVILVLILAVSLAGCLPKGESADNTKFEEELKEKDKKIAELENNLKIKEEENSKLEEEIKTLESTNNSPTNILFQAINVMTAIEDKDMEELSQYVHPSKGLRFTPYPYIDIQQDLVFTAQQVQGLMQDNQIKHWGVYDGSGDPIDLTFSDYYEKFVYDKDFINPHIIGNNTIVSQGNMINNLATVYPNAAFVEFHFNGFDTQYAGIDWASLTLVFEESNGQYYLVGIVHGQWTI